MTFHCVIFKKNIFIDDDDDALLQWPMKPTGIIFKYNLETEKMLMHEWTGGMKRRRTISFSTSTGHGHCWKTNDPGLLVNW